MHPSVERFYDAALARGLEINIIEFDQPTRTAQQAADALGCTVGQIVKSLCFAVDGAPIMALVSGQNQLDTAKLATLLSVPRSHVQRADADLVKQATGFSIGGVPPFGHIEQMHVYMDDHLLTYPTIWAAAGTPHSVFEITPADLLAATGATVADVKKGD